MIEDSHQQILSLLAIIFRLHIRLRVVHEPGVDDLFMSVAGILKLVGLAAFFGGIAAPKPVHQVRTLIYHQVSSKVSESTSFTIWTSSSRQ
jgi:hypothetical protein